MLKTSARVLAWALLAFIVFATLSPLNLRPRLGLGAWVERSGAYFCLSAAFCIGYPTRRRAILAFTVATALVLELGQGLVPTRHARPIDATQKALGAIAGVAAVSLADHRRRRRLQQAA